MIQKLVLGFLLPLSLQAMSLQETIDEALQHNNSLKKIFLDKEVSQKSRRIKQAQNLGRFDATLNYDHYNNARTLVPLTPMQIVSSPTGAYEMPTTNDLVSTGISYNVTLFDGFAKQNSYKISDLAYKNTLFKIKLAKAELIYNVENIYLSLLSLQEQLKAQKKYIEAKKSLYMYIQKAYKLGGKSKLDMLEAKNAYVEAVANKNKITSNIAILKASLSQMIASDKFDKAEEVSVTFEGLQEGEPDLKSLSRLKIAALKSNIAQKRVRTAEALYYPKVDFSAYYGYSMGPNATTNTFAQTGVTYLNKNDFNSENVWQIGLHLQWNLYDFGAKSADVAKEKIALMQSKIDKSITRLELEKNLKIANSKIEIAQADYTALQSQYELLQEIEKAQQIKYENNALSLVDLLDTQAKKELVYAQMTEAKYGYQKAKYYKEYLLEKEVK
ncbi:TolC family protein [Sulfurimonas sp. NW7]|uniref:TolC family protein n=1 Tax=Sulfurimonas sp. NW7 TaxID=2922727 RepID=UPI003DA9C76B